MHTSYYFTHKIIHSYFLQFTKPWFIKVHYNALLFTKWSTRMFFCLSLSENTLAENSWLSLSVKLFICNCLVIFYIFIKVSGRKYNELLLNFFKNILNWSVLILMVFFAFLIQISWKCIINFKTILIVTIKDN